MEFQNPHLLWLLLILIPIIAWYIYKQYQSDASLQISSTKPFAAIAPSKKQWLFHVLFTLRCLVLALLIIVVARPQKSNSVKHETVEGIDIMMALDISGSMLAEDLHPNRLEAAKDVAIDFISDRPNDNIGLVVFAGESFTQCPLTSDHAALINLVKGVQTGMIEDGTAIGVGLANAVNRLKDSKAKSKVIILITDGSNNTGEVAPTTAAQIAKTFGIRVYTIGVGTNGVAPYPFKTPLGIQYQNIPVDIDEPTLKDIAKITDGSYFRATNNKKLRSIYQEIDQMEKTKLRVQQFNKKSEVYMPFLLLALLLLIGEVTLRNTVLRRLP